MKIFLTGATGYIGRVIAEALQAAGHSVAGLARNSVAEQALKDKGITPVSGDLKAPFSLAHPLAGCDGAIHAGTTNDGHLDSEAVQVMLGALQGTQKPFVYTSGIWLLGNTGDQPADENAPLNPPPIVAWRPALEKTVLESASQGVRGIVIRPAMVYGRGGGVACLFIQSANETGAARYIGDGTNRWPMVDVEDLADLYVKAIEKARAGSLFNAAEGPSFMTKDIAAAASFGADAGGKTESWPVEEARQKLGVFLVDALLLDQVVSGRKAREVLGWKPRAVSVLEDLRYGSYAMTRINP